MPTGEVKVTGFPAFVAKGRGTVGWAEQQIDLLREQVDTLEGRLDQLESAVVEGRRALERAVERAEQSAEKNLRSSLRSVVAEGLLLEAVGIAWVLVGLALATWS